MRKTELTTGVLAVLALSFAVKAFIFNGPSAEEAALENIMIRTSIRSYTNEPVSDEQVEKLLRAGMAAPSAANAQPWKFIVIRDKVMLQELADSLSNARIVAGADLAIIVAGDQRKMAEGDLRDYWVDDAAAATENILLAANAMGLGAVWTGIYPRKWIEDPIRKITDMPSYLIPLSMVPIGHPAGVHKPIDKWKSENVIYK